MQVLAHFRNKFHIIRKGYELSLIHICVAYILEEMGLEVCGCHGTTAALALLNDAVKKGGVMACLLYTSFFCAFLW